MTTWTCVSLLWGVYRILPNYSPPSSWHRIIHQGTLAECSVIKLKHEIALREVNYANFSPEKLESELAFFKRKLDRIYQQHPEAFI